MSSDTPSARRWTARILHLFPRRRRRAPHSQRPSVAPVDSSPPSRTTRNRQPRPSDTPSVDLSLSNSHSNSTPALPSPPAARYPRLDDADHLADVNHSTAVMYSVLADIEDGDMVAIVNPMSDDDDYQMARPEYRLFQERVRFANGRNTYYFAGRRQTRISRINDEFANEFRRNLRMLRSNMAGASVNRYECAASDDQIEALPTIVMEKGDTRSVKQIFDSMKDDSHVAVAAPATAASHQCGGLMTSYTECAICLCEFEAGDEITALPCGHVFHLTGCVREWLRNHARTCPTCRADICAPSCASDDVNSHSATLATSEDLT